MFLPRLGVFAVAWLVCLSVLSANDARGDSPDNDGDGISNRNEEVLGTDPQEAEHLRVVLEDGGETAERQKKPGYDATKDFTQIEFCHVGGDRYLWRATFAAPPRVEDSIFHLYVDADADETTGRKVSPGAPNHGTDYMLTVAAGRGYSSVFTPDGVQSFGPPVTYAVQGNTLFISADINLGHDDKGVRYALYVLSHTATTESGRSPGMSDSSPKRLIEGVPLSDKPKILRPTDYTDSHRVAATYGHHLLQRVLSDTANIIVPHDALKTDGFSIEQFNVRRFPYLRLDEPDGKVWTPAPKAGRYHVGFLMYDDSNDDRVGFYVDDKLRGIAVANQDNNQTWLYWLDEAMDFRGGERVELRALGRSGKHGIVNIMFLTKPPEPRGIVYSVQNLTATNAVGYPGRVTLSWSTTWPCPTRLEYGKDTTYGEAIERSNNSLVHRVVVEGLDPNVTWHGRAIGTRRDGSAYRSSDIVFRGKAPAAPATQPETTVVPVTVRNPHPVAAANWPVTSGVPIPQGQLGSDTHVRLLDHAGREVPAQLSTTALWPDNSVKWLLVTFTADVPAESQREYKLEFGKDVKRQTVEHPIVCTNKKGSGLAVDTGRLQFQIDPHGNLTNVKADGRELLLGDTGCHTEAVGSDGANYSTVASDATLAVEESGPIRVVIKTVSPLIGSDGQRLFRIEKRIEAYRGSPFLRIQHTFVVDRPERFTDIESLAYRVPVAAEEGVCQVPTVAGQPVVLDTTQTAVRQRFDNEFITISDGQTAVAKGRVIGTLAGKGASGLAVAVRDFWQNYPKGFSVHANRLDIELCPDFDAGLYDRFPFEKEGHQLYYALLDGHYRLKRGVAKTHELLLCAASEPEREATCRLFQRPLLATAPPAWYCDSKAFYEVAPRDTERFRLYEEAIDRNLTAYADRRERQHDFGMLNYGDWYGERGTNWGNIEYDTQHAFFLEYIRSGNPDAFFLGEATELHNRDIDTVQWSENSDEIGAVYVHQMCHVGDYYDKPVPGSLGFPHGGYTVSHAWVEGHFDHYFLTGDRRSYEAGCAVADFFVRKELGRPYDFSSTRVPGWHLIMLAAAWHATGDPYYLNAAKVVIDRVLETQDIEPRPLPAYQQEGRQPYQLGGWSRMMVPGHCQCEPRHRGNAGFMIAVLLSGLKYYYDVTGDPQVKEAIIRGAHYLLDETYSDDVHGFRYTSCPKTSYRAGSTPLMAEGVARAYLWTRDDRFRRVLTEALPLSAGGSSYGKGFSMYYRCAPRVLADLAAAGLDMSDKTDH